MQVNKRLQINVAFSIITAFVVVLVLFLTLSRVNRAMEESEIANEILSSAFERSTFKSDYLRTSNERARVQWFAKSEEIGRLLKFASDKFKDAEDKKTIDEMIKDHESTVKLFSDIVENRERTRSGSASAELSQEIENRLVAQLNMRLYDKVLHTRRLREAAEQHLFATLRMAGWSIFFVIAAVTAAATINSWAVGRTIINRVRLLRDGASIIGQGNLDHRIETKGDDEFAELSKAFNAMTVKLRASYLNLENEIAGHKRAEEALRLSEERFRVALQASPVTVSTMDCDLRFTWVYNTRHGFRPETVIGKRPDELIPPEDAAELMALLRHVLETGVAERREVSGRTKGVRWDYYSTVEPLREEHGKVAGLTLAQIDITERKRAEEDIKKLNEELKRNVDELAGANKELEAFVYSVSHDLRAPLRSITGFSDFLLQKYSDKLDDKGKKYLNWVINGAAKMNQIIDDLLHLSRISRQEIHRQDVDLSKAAGSIIAELRQSQPDRRVTIDIKEGITACADPGLIEVALSNLLRNAWKFTSKTENARIEFGAFTKDGKTVYYVKDNGAGFDPNFEERLFLPFHRLHSEQEFEGSGIGLATVERVIRRHGGKIWAEGKTNEGAAFFFTVT